MKFSISQKELTELLKAKFRFKAESKIRKGELVISAMMGTVKFSAKALKVPVSLKHPVDFDISMSLAVKTFLGRVQRELKERKLDKAISITPTKLSVDLNPINGNAFIDWIKTKTLKRLEFENGEISIEV
ncbi:MAG: hypothetical protein GWP10_14720 [Nitrospiraceae bacterium]|nr:hypothetical protein [Nitrospiraceae bacterium]